MTFNRCVPAWLIGALVALLLCGAASAGAATPARELYGAAMAREKALRAAWDDETHLTANPAAAAAAAPMTTLRDTRAIVAAYETIVRRYPTSGYCDNALWQAAGLAADAFARWQQGPDRLTAVRLFEFLAREYPTSPFVKKAVERSGRLQNPTAASAPTPATRAEPSSRGRELPAEPAPARPVGAPSSPPAAAAPASLSTIGAIKRTVLAEVVRVSIELDREVAFHEERVEGPARLLFDLPATKAAPSLQDANWTYQDDIVRRIRVGRHLNQTTRVVLDLEGVSRYTVVTLYNPYRILIDCERAAGPQRPTAAETTRPAPARTEQPPPRRIEQAPAVDGRSASSEPATTDPARLPGGEKTLPPDGGRVSMARQLGLGVSRIVIDPGHGGRDPGAEGPNINESQIVLDIALRLEKLLTRQPGVDVVLTRRTDVFVPLEQRTQIANREQADLFLSIHANASRNQNARGIESYYLNFASNPEAEAVAARENAASERTMNNLPDIVKAIALNNKLDESKDFAKLVQQALGRKLRPSNKTLKDLGVKQAPFVVLIGAAMPSVLAEVSFVTNRREGQLLRGDAYRQRIAEALADAILRYRRALKSASVVAHQ
jgi:N-acetylmuramoyl-L-alanine amidase